MEPKNRKETDCEINAEIEELEEKIAPYYGGILIFPFPEMGSLSWMR